MTRFVIDTNDILHNFDLLASKTDALIIPMLKADCYGLGAKKVMELLHGSRGVNLFAVSRLEEALQLTEGGCQILITSCYGDKTSLGSIIESGFTFAVGSKEQARLADSIAKETGVIANIHIKVDTGFGRFGFLPSDVDAIKEVYSFENLKVCGVFSHFSSAFSNEVVTNRQFEEFKAVLDSLTDSGYDTGITHISNSSAALKSDKYHLDAVRTGSALLGRLPFTTDLPLKKVGVFKTQIADIRTLKKGSNIGYGNVFTLKRDTRVAVLCTGSADGVLIKKDYDTYRVFDILRYGFAVFKMLFRDNRPVVRVNGKIARTVGRVALTHTFVDVTDIDCKCGDNVTINVSPLYVSPNVKREYV